jgi:hypothetical protein
LVKREKGEKGKRLEAKDELRKVFPFPLFPFLPVAPNG